MMSLSMTVLPQPLSPMMQTVSPRWIVRSMSRRTCWYRKRMLTFAHLDQVVSPWPPLCAVALAHNNPSVWGQSDR